MPEEQKPVYVICSETPPAIFRCKVKGRHEDELFIDVRSAEQVFGVWWHKSLRLKARISMIDAHPTFEAAREALFLAIMFEVTSLRRETATLLQAAANLVNIDEATSIENVKADREQYEIVRFGTEDNAS